MKRKATIILGILLLMNCLGQAQSSAVKFGATDAFLGIFNLSNEYAISQSQSIQIKIGYIDPALSPFITEENITPSSYRMEDRNGGINSSLEYRFYVTEGETMQGLYIAPYLRYLNQRADYSDEINANDFMVDFRLHMLGAGAQLGYQMIVAKHLSLDFYFFGAGLDYHMVNLKYKLKQQQTGFNYASIIPDVNNVFKDIDYLHKRLDNKPYDDHLNTKLPFFFPGFRLGLNLGVAF